MDKGLYLCLNRSMSEKNDYFDYVSQVLGVKSILNDLQASDTKKTPLLIAVEGYLAYDDSEKDLLIKIISALKIEQKNIQVTDLSEVNQYQAEFFVYFTDNQNLINSTEDNLVQTYSPKYLLKNPDYKKNAWNDLQKVIAHFKQYN